MKLKLRSLGKGDIHFDELATAVSRVYTVTVFRYFICALSSLLSKALLGYHLLRREALPLIITIIIIITIQSHTKGTHTKKINIRRVRKENGKAK